MEHSFGWSTNLSPERQKEIHAWIRSLSMDEEEMLEDLLRETINDVEDRHAVESCGFED